uniref:Guanine deaminase n=1 Tax=Cacopsylla melanoneura TaxID=428564 RepID=A0A8D9AEJ2_9HEMI
MTSKVNIFIGSAIHWNLEADQIEYIEQAAITVQDGKITEFSSDANHIDHLQSSQSDCVTLLSSTQFLIPGFIDAHIHAPQYPNLGLGVDLPLLKWLDKYIFALERKFKDLEFAKDVYTKLVDKMIAHGTTTACYFGTIHTDSCLLLADIVHARGQRALVGKVNMTVNCPQDYGETLQESLDETERFVTEMKKKNYSSVQPVITPRFAVTCEMAALQGLAQIASKHDLPIQTHLSENVDEIATVLKMNPDCRTYTEVYERAGLLTKKTILAHSIHLSDQELAVIWQHGASIVHCPSSNCFLQSGACDTVRTMQRGVNIALGTDMGAGYSPSILEVMRRSVDVSSVLTSCRIKEKEEAASKRKCSGMKNQDEVENEMSPGIALRPPLNFERAFQFATLGGARALNLADKVGNFSVGKQFDALLVNLDSVDSPVDFTAGLKLQEKFLKFFFTGDDRNIERVYVNGKLVLNKSPS